MKGNKTQAGLLSSLVSGFFIQQVNAVWLFRVFFSCYKKLFTHMVHLKTLISAEPFFTANAECSIEKCSCCSQGLGAMGRIEQNLGMGAQCSMKKWRIYTCCYGSAVCSSLLFYLPVLDPYCTLQFPPLVFVLSWNPFLIALFKLTQAI